MNNFISTESIKLSVVIVNLNNSKSLETTVCTLLEQTYSNYELIIIDGGSTDGSKEIISQFAYLPILENKFKWVSEKDNGIYHAMNKGIEMAKGEYCYFLNSGELLYDKFVFEKIFASNPTESILVGNIIMVYDHVVRIEKKPDLSFGYFYEGSICHQSAFIKRDLFLKYGLYDETLKIVSDWKFFLITIVLNNESVKYFDVDIAYHDLFGVSITQTELYSKERRTVLETLFSEYILKDYDTYWAEINQMKRLKDKGFISWFISMSDRVLNKWRRIVHKKEMMKINIDFIARISELNN